MIEKKPLTVFIVDDSKVARELLSHIIEADPSMKIVGMAENGEEAIGWLKFQPVDVVTMDIHMPIIDGFEVTKRIMETKPVPIVIISSGYTPSDNHLVFRSLEAGALAILEKPNLLDSNFKAKANEIVNTIKTISGIKLIRRREKNSRPIKPAISTPDEVHDEVQAVAIGASLGGPQAIASIIAEISPSFAVPIFIVQHIAEGFTTSFVHWLQESCPLKVRLAQDGEKAEGGCIYIAPDKCHMQVKKGGIIELDPTVTSGIQPSVANLFKSMAETYGKNGVGVLLTGMGSDGAKELLLMKQNGAYTIVQDEESCIVYGMPKVAVSLGAAMKVLPLDAIAAVLNSLVERKAK